MRHASHGLPATLTLITILQRLEDLLISKKSYSTKRRKDYAFYPGDDEEINKPLQCVGPYHPDVRFLGVSKRQVVQCGPM